MKRFAGTRLAITKLRGVGLRRKLHASASEGFKSLLLNPTTWVAPPRVRHDSTEFHRVPWRPMAFATGTCPRPPPTRQGHQIDWSELLWQVGRLPSPGSGQDNSRDNHPFWKPVPTQDDIDALRAPAETARPFLCAETGSWSEGAPRRRRTTRRP